MKLKDIKNELDKLSTEELEKEFIYNSDEFTISGIIEAFKKAETDLYVLNEDDPSRLFTYSELETMGLSEEDIEISKNNYYITF